MCLHILARCFVVALLLGMSSSLAFAGRNIEEVPDDSTLDESTRAVLEKVKRPANVAPEAWEDALALYKIKMGKNARVDFFGMVVDERMMPIEGVRVSGFVLSFDSAYIENRAPGMSDQKECEWTAVTDKEGRFAVRGLRGISLHVKTLEKDGYVAPPYREYFRISDKHFRKNIYNSREDEPIVFKMWLKRDTDHAADLIRKEIKISGPADGREYRVDLARGSCVTNAGDIFDISLKIISASHNAGAGPRYDWSFSLSAPGGGLVSTDDAHPYNAPEGGYVPLVVGEHSSSDKTWSRRAQRRYYVRSRGGALFGLIDVTVHVYRDGSSLVRINSVVNDSGSRSLMNLR